MRHLHKNLFLATSYNAAVMNDWLAEVAKRNTLIDIDILSQAVGLLALVGQDKLTPYGESCLQHGLAMANIVNDLGVDADAVAAALLYSSVQYGDLPLENVSEHLGDKVAKLINGAKQLIGIDDFYRSLMDKQQYHYNLDNIRKMFLAIVDDVMIVIIKLAERLYALRHVADFADKQKTQIAKSIAEIYAPLANRLGISQLKWEMEDLSFRYLEPDTYYKISKSLKENRITRETYIENFICLLTDVLTQTKIKDFKVSGRVKHIYSIYRKMQRKQVGLENIYDINAVRVFVPTIASCYEVLSAVHASWEQILAEFDDYIANPKPNGYRSIHTAVVGPQDKVIEIQIRTFSMHEEAELGVAAHWLYKEGKVKSQMGYEEKIMLLRQVMSWQEEVVGGEEKKKEIQQIFRDRVYVFTPQNDLLDLPFGATPLDFAYRVHTEVGNRCIGAKINGQIVPLSYKLQTGERIEILTAKRGQPSRDWLNAELGFLQTPHARAKVLAWFKKQHYADDLKIGQSLLAKEQKRLGMKQIHVEQIATKLDYKSKDDMLAALGSGELKTGDIFNVVDTELLREHEQRQQADRKDNMAVVAEAAVLASQVRVQEQMQALPEVQVQGVDNLLTHMASCCKPVPGDKIIGYVTQGRGVSIHRSDCANIVRAEQERPERLLAVNWGEMQHKHYQVDLVIEAFDHSGLARDITGVFADAGVMVAGLQYVADAQKQIAHIYITIEVESLDIFNKILLNIEKISGVLKAWRS